MKDETTAVNTVKKPQENAGKKSKGSTQQSTLTKFIKKEEVPTKEVPTKEDNSKEVEKV